MHGAVLVMDRVVKHILVGRGGGKRGWTELSSTFWSAEAEVKGERGVDRVVKYPFSLKTCAKPTSLEFNVGPLLRTVQWPLEFSGAITS